jgi:hypothetical protein
MMTPLSLIGLYTLTQVGFWFFVLQSVWFLLGIIAMVALIVVKPARIKNSSVAIYFSTAAVGIVAALFGPSHSGLAVLFVRGTFEY